MKNDDNLILNIIITGNSNDASSNLKYLFTNIDLFEEMNIIQTNIYTEGDKKEDDKKAKKKEEAREDAKAMAEAILERGQWHYQKKQVLKKELLWENQ